MPDDTSIETPARCSGCGGEWFRRATYYAFLREESLGGYWTTWPNLTGQASVVPMTVGVCLCGLPLEPLLGAERGGTGGRELTEFLTALQKGRGSAQNASVAVGTPNVTVSEIANAANGANLANYTSWLSCTGVTATGTTSASFTMPDNDVTCTLTNTRKQGTLRIAKICAPTTASQNFTVNVSTYGNVSLGCGGSTSAISLPTGTYTVGESSLPSGWVTGGSVATAIGGGWAAPGTFSGDCDANGSVTLNSGDNKTCYILNVNNVCTPAFSFAPSSGGSAMPVAPMTAVPNRQPAVPRTTTNPQRIVRK